MLKLEDINGAADSKLNNLIKESVNYNKGKSLGAELKKVVSKNENDTDHKTVNKMFKNKSKKFSKSKQEDIKEADNEDEEEAKHSSHSHSSGSDSSDSSSKKDPADRDDQQQRSSSGERGKSLSKSSSKKSSAKKVSLEDASDSEKEQPQIDSRNKLLLPFGALHATDRAPLSTIRRASGYPVDPRKDQEDADEAEGRGSGFGPPKSALLPVKPSNKNLLLPPSKR